MYPHQRGKASLDSQEVGKGSGGEREGMDAAMLAGDGFGYFSAIARCEARLPRRSRRPKPNDPCE